jgi:cation:H+ antiporter
MLLYIIFIILGLTGLYYGSDWLVIGSSRIALRFNIPPIIIGLTIVAVGTSMPELVVSILAAIQDKPGLALGNVIGSNITNIGLILGITGLVRVISVKETLVKREIPLMIVVTIFATMLTFDGVLNRLDGLLLLFGFILFNYAFYYIARHEGAMDGQAVEELDIEIPEVDDIEAIRLTTEAIRILIGAVILVIAAQLMVNGATNFARAIGVSELVIGVTMVAFGTSLPELATSLTAAFKGESDIAVGNVIGSNITNLLLVLGGSATVATINVRNTDLSIVEYVVMLGFSLLLWPFARRRELSRVESALFLGAYFAFVIYSFLN